MDIDTYLTSSDALSETVSAQGRLLQVGQELNGLSIRAFLGRGAMSEVWRVRDIRQDRDYALKIFAPAAETHASARARFVSEAHALDEFRHPNLVRCYRFQEEGEHPYYLMDVLKSLPEHLPAPALAHVLDDILSGLEALHERKIVHRDLKPSNILLDAGGRAVLADLGVMHVADPDLAKRLGDTAVANPTLLGKSPFVGTTHYAAPEQLAGEDITPATDLYQLGVVLEELLGETAPRPWRKLVRSLTAARPAHRPQSVRAVRALLRRMRCGPVLRRTLLAVAGVAAAVLLAFRHTEPNWVEIADLQSDLITLDGGRYYQPTMHYQPLAEPAQEMTTTATNALERQFQRMFSARFRRQPVRIQGKGTLRCPDVIGCEIHLSPGITFITSGRFNPDGAIVKAALPPSDATWNEPGTVGYPAFVVEKGASLVFTENDAYPPALIRRE